MSGSLRPHGLEPTRLLHPWNFAGKSTGVGCHFFLQGIFPTQGSNPGLPHRRQTFYHLSHLGSLQTLLHTSKNLLSISVSYLFSVLFSLLQSIVQSSSPKSCEIVENKLILIMWFNNGMLARRHFCPWLTDLEIILVPIFLFWKYIKYFSGYICIRKSSKSWWECKEYMKNRNVLLKIWYWFT